MDKAKYLMLPDGKRIKIEYAIRCCCTIEKIVAAFEIWNWMQADGTILER